MQIYLFFYIVGTAWGVENRFAAEVIILSVFEGLISRRLSEEAFCLWKSHRFVFQQGGLFRHLSAMAQVCLDVFKGE